MPYIDKDFLQSILYSSTMFSIVSSRTNNELESIFNEAGHTMDLDTIRHIRNSFIHGRYFFNYKDGFEIYDGTNDLQHYATINFKTIKDIYKTFSHNNIFELVKTRELIDYKLMQNSTNPNEPI